MNLINHSIHLIIVLAALPFNLNAEPIVIYDNGQTQPLSRYQVVIKTPIQVPHYTIKAPSISFPVTTPELKPGKVNPRRIHNPYLEQPIFIIGADPQSMAWLQHHAGQLKKIQATGIVVNIDSAQQLDQMRQMAGGLAINPVTASKLAKQLSLQHYPVLISQTRIEQ